MHIWTEIALTSTIGSQVFKPSVLPKSDRLPKTVFRFFCMFSLRDNFAYICKHIVVKRFYKGIIHKIKKLSVFASNLYDSALLYLHVNPKNY